MEIIYEFNWCNYFTPCTHYDDIMVGEYDCATCSFNQGIEKVEDNNLKMIPDNEDYYTKYDVVNKGIVKCSCLLQK